MKTVCVAVVVLSVISVCQPASLGCDKLGKPVDQGPDIIGKWYVIGISSKVCWAVALLNSLMVPSFQMDITSSERQNYYNTTLKMKSYGACENTTTQLFYEVNTLFDVNDQKDSQVDQKAVLLHTGCQDCIVISGNTSVDLVILLSRRPVITADEMKEFETQAGCLGLYKPQILGTDHDFGSCTEIDFESSDFGALLEQRLKNMFSELFACTTDSYLYYPRAAYSWAQETWASLW